MIVERLPRCETQMCLGDASNLLIPVTRRGKSPTHEAPRWLCAECRGVAVAGGYPVSFIPTKIMSRLMDESRARCLEDW